MTAPFKRILTLDFETRWCTKTGYTLSKMTTEEYIRHERFKAFGCGVNWFGEKSHPIWLTRCELPAFFDRVDWSSTAILAHNAQFDASILAWHYGRHPAFIFDTLSMARALRGVEVGNSAQKLALDFGLPPKGKALHSTDGLDELTPEIEEELAEYCKHDVWLAEEFFRRLNENYPAKELRLIDMTVRMYARPLLQLDKSMLVDAIHEEKEKREGLLSRLGVDEAALASNPQFAQVLESLGVEAPTKISKTTGLEAFAFAKNDAHFQQLANGSNEEVVLLCEARLAVKSTIARTRAQRFLDIAHRGALPVPLAYFGAGTGRWTASKGSAINMQNLKRGSFLRKAIMAPPGYELGVGDLSQIEPRVLAWLTDYTDLLDIFRSGADVYAAFGTQMFGIPITAETHPVERQAAKSALLGCGYGLGWVAFATQLLVGFMGAPPVRYDIKFAKTLGLHAEDVQAFMSAPKIEEKLAAIPHICTMGELIVHCVCAKAIIDKYRRAARPVVNFWGECDELIGLALHGGKEYRHKCLVFKKGQIILPSGMPMNYPNLHVEPVYDENNNLTGRRWVYGPQDKFTALYGGKVTNNVTQGTARCVMTDGMLRTAKRFPVVGTVHDEQIVLLPEEGVEEAYKWVMAQMVMEPPYMPGIPLAASGGHARRYGEAK